MIQTTKRWVRLIVVGLAFGVTPVAGQSIRMIDINQQQAGSSPREFLALGDAVFFTAFFPGAGRELWHSDGTEQGTSRLFTDSFGFVVYSLTRVGDLVCFIAPLEDESTLWCSSGTPAGTVPIDAPDVHFDLFFNRGVSFNGFWYFHGGRPGVAGLWRTDGTSVGTTLVVPGSVGSEMVRYGDGVAFVQATESTGRELWITDGTLAGTRMVADVWPGTTGSGPRLLTVAGPQLFFLADDGVHGEALWQTTASTGETRLVADLNPGLGLSPVLEAVAVGNFLYFRDQNRLWRTDGIEVSLLIDGDASLWELITVGASLYWVADEDLLRIADATGLPTLVRSFADRPARLTAFGDELVFYAIDDVVGGQLWSTDGNAAGTEPISSFLPSQEAKVTNIVATGGRLWLAVRDREHGVEPWVSDGTPAGTRLVRDMNDFGTESASPRNLTWLNDRWVFLAKTVETEVELWASDGTTAGTRVLLDIAPDVEPRPVNIPVPTLVRLGDELIFAADDGQHGWEPWITDGTEAGTRMIRDINPGANASSFPFDLVSTGSFVFFLADDGVSGREWWRTDGSEAGTILVSDLASDGFFVGETVAANGRLFFATGAFHDRDFWVSDGTPDGTIQLLDGMSETWLLPFRNGVLFRPADLGTDLWFTDGSVAGTGPLFSVSVSTGTVRHPPVVLEDRLIFAIEDKSPKELWVSNGTTEGTELVSTLPGGGLDAAFDFTTRVGRHVYFEMDTLPGGSCELWVTDGSSEGTRLVRSLGDARCLEREGIGVGARYLSTYAKSDSNSVFGAGTELWTSDGSFDGTHQLLDIWPGPVGSEPRGLTSNGRSVVFAANDGVHGEELWFLDDPCLVQGDPLWLHDGRFKAEACWRVEPDRVGTSGPLPITDTTGGLFFFNPANLDLALKIHDGREVNGTFWFFLAGLTNVAADVRVVDMHTGRARDFMLPGGSFESIGSVSGFPDLPPDAPVPPTAWMPFEAGHEASKMLPSKGVATCGVVAALCLNQDRFRVAVAWHTNDQQGEGQPVPLTDNSGTFWFFRPENVELFVKIHDGRPNNGHFWVFLGALSNVGYTVTVTDTQTGATREYVNEPGTLRSFGDTLAFPG